MARVKNCLVEQCIQQKMKERYFGSGFSSFICYQQASACFVLQQLYFDFEKFRVKSNIYLVFESSYVVQTYFTLVKKMSC